MSDSQAAPPNPYVGPRAFLRGETLYGRDRELKKLLDVLIAERIVLLHSPSGAGKTSLIQALLIPAMEEELFRVLPIVRVGSELPTLAAGAGAPNRYILSMLLSLEADLPPAQQTPLETLATMTLEDYFQSQPAAADETRPVVLIFDQFEEILTTDPTNQAAREAFFAQLGAVLRDRNRWALFSMREDFVASLDPYLRPLPTRLSTTFRLDLPGEDAARQAVQEPARQAGVDFRDEAVTSLVDDLRCMRVQTAGGIEEQPGQVVEPVQLQVVCYRLWERLPPGATEITSADISAVGSVDDALAAYYDERVALAAAATGVDERFIRDWIERHLISVQGIRGQVLQEPERSQGLDNRAIALLIDAHLIRAEQRRGAIWYELTHDRLIEPLRNSNAAWLAANLSSFQRRAALWEQQNNPDGLLLQGPGLLEAEEWAAAHPGELLPHEQNFLEASQKARAAARREQYTNLAMRWLAGLAVLASIAAIAAGTFAFLSWQSLIEASRMQGATDQIVEMAQGNQDIVQETTIALQQTALGSEGAGEPPENQTAYARQARELATEAAWSRRTVTAVKATQEHARGQVEQLIYPAPTLTAIMLRRTETTEAMKTMIATSNPIERPVIPTFTRTPSPTTGPTSARTAIARERTSTALAFTATARALPPPTAYPPPASPYPVPPVPTIPTDTPAAGPTNTSEAYPPEPSPAPLPATATATETVTSTTTATTTGTPTDDAYPLDANDDNDENDD